MARKRVSIEHEMFWRAELTIDEAVAMPFIKDMVDFWSGSQMLLKECGGDYLMAFCKNLSEYLYRVACEGKSDEYPKLQTDEEGWCQLTAEYGFFDLRMDEVTYNHEDFIINIT